MAQIKPYDDLVAHLTAVRKDPSKPLDTKSLDAAALTLPSAISAEQRKDLISQIYSLIPLLQQDPSALIRLLAKLLAPVPLLAVLAFDPPVDFLAGLDLNAQPFNSLILSLLDKASTVEAERLITQQPELLPAIIRLWLCTEAGGIADQAGDVLYGWLEADWRESRETNGLGGALWKRVFRDKDVYNQILATCSLKHSVSGSSLSKSRKTIAQARLLGVLPKLARLDWKVVTQSYHPELEAVYGLKSGQQGLLDYASLHMVDRKDDVLMHRTLIDFFSKLLVDMSSSEIQSTSSASIALDYLQSRGLHDRTLRYYTQPDHPSHDPIDSSFLFSAAANYAATCLERSPEYFTGNDEALKTIVLRIRGALSSIGPARWNHGQAPVDDLHVLSCIPRTLLQSLGRENPLLIIPTNVASKDGLNTLATVFHGPIRFNEIVFPPVSVAAGQAKSAMVEGQGAADLYCAYAAHNPSMWSDIVRQASTIALGDVALAAVNLIKAVITANWTPSNTSTKAKSAVADTDVEMSDAPSAQYDPIASAILSDTASAKATIIPYLLSPPKTFGNLVGGHGDAESAAYKVAVAKFDALKALYECIKSRKEYMSIAALARERLNEGVMGREAGVGGRIATLEL